MSDVKSENKELLLMVEQIASKINNAPALNGGFDKMLIIMEHVQDKQEETSSKVDQIYDGLYKPDDGLYARVRTVQTFTNGLEKQLEEHTVADKASHTELFDNLKKLIETDVVHDKQLETTLKLKKIAGEDLERLHSVLQVKTIWTNIWGKVAWLVLGSVLAAIGKTIWETLSHH